MAVLDDVLGVRDVGGVARGVVGECGAKQR